MIETDNRVGIVLDLYEQAGLFEETVFVLTADHECGGVAVHDAKNSNLDIRFTSDYHSANFVPIWASGPGAEVFDAFMDNTEIGLTLIDYVKNR